MSTRTILLTLHITAIASWLGADVMQHAMRHRWARETSDANIAWARVQFWLHDRYYVVVAAVIFASGVALVQDGDWAWSAWFVWAGIATIVAGAMLGGIVLKALAQKRADALAAAETEVAAAAYRHALPIELLLTTFVVVTVIAMVHKWGA